MVASLEPGAGRPDAVHDADPFVTQDAARRASGHVAFQNVKVGAADGGAGHPHNRVVSVLKGRLGPFFQGLESRTAINQSLHGEFL